MMIQNNQLDQEQLHQLNQLVASCKDVDGGTPVVYWHLLSQARSTSSNFLYYVDAELVGFLSLYFFYEDACEISLLVHPAHRRQHIATQLLQEAKLLLMSQSIQRVIFSTAPSFVNLWNLSYMETEYHMERLGTELAPALIIPSLEINPATLKDIAVLAQIDAACFPNSETNTPNHFTELLSNPNYCLLMARFQGKPIGKAHLRKQGEDMMVLSDIAILPEFQKQGYGSQLIAQSINDALKQNKSKLILDVSDNNPSNAQNRYLRYGFKVIAQYDYWATWLQELER